MTTILVVDDEANIRNLVSAYLEKEGYTVYAADDGPGALAAFRRYHPDLLVLDVMLPGLDGLEVLQQVRRESDVYVLLLTAKSEETDRIVGLTVGADDYLTKPFSPRELVARVKAILRRGRGATPEDDRMLAFAHIRIDGQRHQVWRDDQPVELTALEFKLLRTLATYAGMVLSREQLLERVWGYEFYGDERVVDVHIGHLRHKLEADPAQPDYLITVRGVGYKFEDHPR
jgi:two-component system, OmpR family, alkaline phosphatase synthesis response regulator PhoP